MLVFMNDDLIDMKDNHLMLSRMDNEETLENCKEDSNDLIVKWIGETPHTQLFVYAPSYYQSWQVDKIIVDNEHEPPCVLVFLQEYV